MSNSVYSSGRLSIAICDRCGLKFKYQELRADGAKPTMRVCSSCYDLNNPLKTWKPRDVSYALQYPRPDVLLTINWVRASPVSVAINTQQNNAVLGVDNSTAINDGAPNNLPDREFVDSFNNYVPPSRGGNMGNI